MPDRHKTWRCTAEPDCPHDGMICCGDAFHELLDDLRHDLRRREEWALEEMDRNG